MQLRTQTLKKNVVTAITLVLTVVAALELVFVPVDRVLASPPNMPLVTCSLDPPTHTAVPRCTFVARYYIGGGSLTYCFLGEGALYMKGVYYPLTQPGASPAREVSNSFCPAMHR